jgi:NodT family efflux transporter outer membrane factor (OMF) lipoprotein
MKLIMRNQYLAYFKLGILSVGIAVFVSACGVVQPYSRPINLPLNGLYRDNASGDTIHSLANINWHNFYNDPDLQKLITAALESNSDIRLALNKLNQADQYVQQSKAAFLPTLSANANGSLSRVTIYGPSTPPTSQPYQDWRLYATASWEADIWGKLRSAKKAQLATYLQQQATVALVKTELVANIASAYYQLIMLDKQKAITNKNIDSYAKYLETVKNLKKAAQVNEVAVLQAKAQLASAKAYLPQIDASIATNENYICMLLGRTPSPIVRSTDIDLILFHTEELNAGIPVQLLNNRPDVQAAEYALRASHEQFNIAKAAMYPQLTLGGDIGTESKSITNWFNLPGSLLWNTIAGLTQPILTGRTLKTQKEIARLQEDAALISFRQSLLTAGSEVSNALANIHFISKQAEYQKEQVDELAKAYEYSQELLVNGYATYLDVLSAQNNVLSTELALYNTYNNVIQQKIILYRALGGGWK